MKTIRFDGIAFKNIFGSIENINVLKDILNTITNLDILDIRYVNYSEYDRSILINADKIDSINSALNIIAFTHDKENIAISVDFDNKISKGFDIRKNLKNLILELAEFEEINRYVIISIKPYHNNLDSKIRNRYTLMNSGNTEDNTHEKLHGYIEFLEINYNIDLNRLKALDQNLRSIIEVFNRLADNIYNAKKKDLIPSGIKTHLALKIINKVNNKIADTDFIKDIEMIQEKKDDIDTFNFIFNDTKSDNTKYNKNYDRCNEKYGCTGCENCTRHCCDMKNLFNFEDDYKWYN